MSVQNTNVVAARANVIAGDPPTVLASDRVASVTRLGVGSYDVELMDAFAPGERVIAAQVTDALSPGEINDAYWTSPTTIRLETDTPAGDPADLAWVLTVYRLPTTGNP